MYFKIVSLRYPANENTIHEDNSAQPQHICLLAYCFHQRMTQSLLCLKPLKEMQFHAEFQHKIKEDEFPHHIHK